jgi:hypothetical protein
VKPDHRQLDEELDRAVELDDFKERDLSLDELIAERGIDAVGAAFSGELLAEGERRLAARYRRVYPWLP